MDFKVTSIKSTARKAGFTLIEMTIGLGVAGIVLLMVAALSSYTARSMAGLANYTDLDQNSRTALDTMSQEIRQARRLTDGSTNRLVFEDSDGGTLQYFYDREAKTLRRTKNGGTSRILLDNCQSLTFAMYQRNPVAGSYDVYPTATPATCKLIQLKWTCSRDLLKTGANTESVQSSKIVIRKQ
jgi:prepilin-type N-terminal cleavage/methylation domain-containing protein